MYTMQEPTPAFESGSVGNGKKTALLLPLSSHRAEIPCRFSVIPLHQHP
jgi:hypothetical protein